jgi:predicted RNA-binding Zn ribbon-like protein
MLSDHPVLEFLNTTPMVGGKLRDLLQTDSDVLSTLARLGWPMKFKGTGLLTAARELREELRQLIERRKAGELLNLAQLNKFLGEAKSYLKLRQERDGSLALEEVWEHRTPPQALAPVAAAAANLLATGDFELVRRCESETCVLWFYDRSKSHQRRWCSMASCGNRHKVAAFRKRLSDA